jgi:hypothetical protein
MESYMTTQAMPETTIETRTAISALKAEIKTRENEIRSLRSAMRREKNLERLSCLQSERYLAGNSTRYSLLAYAMLRGVPYRSLEAKVRKTNEPGFGTVMWYAQRALGEAQKGFWDAVRVRAWLEGETLSKAPQEAA